MTKLLTQDELENERLSIERERLEIEKKKASSDMKFLNRNFGAVIGAIVSLAAIFVSVSQLWIAQISRERELESSDRQAEREYNLNWARFISDNERLLFSKDQQERDFIRAVMLSAFPPEKVYILADQTVRATGSDTSAGSKKIRKTFTELQKSLPAFEFDGGGMAYNVILPGTYVIHLETCTLGKKTEASLCANGQNPPINSCRHIENWSGDWTIDLSKGHQLGVFTKEGNNGSGPATTGAKGGAAYVLNYYDGSFFVSFSVRRKSS